MLSDEDEMSTINFRFLGAKDDDSMYEVGLIHEVSRVKAETSEEDCGSVEIGSGSLYDSSIPL